MKIAICGYKGKTGSKVYDLLKENNYEIKNIDVKDVEKETTSNVFDLFDLENAIW